MNVPLKVNLKVIKTQEIRSYKDLNLIKDACKSLVMPKFDPLKISESLKLNSEGSV